MRYIDGRGYYTVAEVAEAAGISQQTVRTWERRGHVRTRRSPGGHRLFDQEALKSVIDHAITQKRKADSEPAIPDPAADISDWELASTGARIRAAREQAGLTQKAVAKKADISRSLLSAIERGISGVSITVYSRIANVLDMPMAGLSPPSPPGQRLIRRDQRPRSVLADGVTWEELAAPGNTMAPAMLYVPPGATSGGLVTLPRENLIVVLDGQLDFHLPDTATDVTLNDGDSLMVATGEVHSWANPTTTPTRVMWVAQLAVKPKR